VRLDDEGLDPVGDGVKRIEVAGRTMYTVTRYDVSELVRLRQMREEFSHSLIEHQGEERRRMAREVHDSTMQQLASLALRPQASVKAIGTVAANL